MFCLSVDIGEMRKIIFSLSLRNEGIADVEKPRICMKKAVRGGTAYIYNK